jgi:hypothetical protein
MDFTSSSLILDGWRHSGPGAFQFTVTSIGVPTYVIDASTNLSDWTAIKTNTLTPYDYTEPNMLANPRRFFRARSLP